VTLRCVIEDVQIYQRKHKDCGIECFLQCALLEKLHSFQICPVCNLKSIAFLLATYSNAIYSRYCSSECYGRARGDANESDRTRH
jgi:hypothetical protein